MKMMYLDSIRENTCYPAFRLFISATTVLSYIIAVILVIAGAFGGQVIGGIFGLIAAAVLVLIAKVGREISLMIADIADATIESASRQQESASITEKTKLPITRNQISTLPDSQTNSDQEYRNYFVYKDIKIKHNNKDFDVDGVIFHSANDAKAYIDKIK